MHLENIALITARGGSKRLPRKNAKIFCGHPLVAWSIMQAKCSKLIDRVILTSDDEEILNIGRKYGAITIKRPVLNDGISASYVLKLAIEEIKTWGIYPKNIVYLLPTSPLRKPHDLDTMIKEYIRLNIDELQTSSITKELFIYENIDINDISTKLKNVISNKSYKYSTQTGGWGIARTEYLMDLWEKQSAFDQYIDDTLSNNQGKEIYGYNIENWQCFETDYEDQFKLCELIMNQFILNNRDMQVYIDYAKSVNKELDLNFYKI